MSSDERSHREVVRYQFAAQSTRHHDTRQSDQLCSSHPALRLRVILPVFGRAGHDNRPTLKHALKLLQ